MYIIKNNLKRPKTIDKKVIAKNYKKSEKC